MPIVTTFDSDVTMPSFSLLSK